MVLWSNTLFKYNGVHVFYKHKALKYDQDFISISILSSFAQNKH